MAVDVADVAQPQNTGIMIAFFLDALTAEKLAIPSGEKPQDMHITLAYLQSDVTMLSDTDVANLIKLVGNFADTTSPLPEGMLSGVARFNAPEGEPTPIVALVNMHGLHDLHDNLLSMLFANGFPVHTEFAYQPHVTLAYVDADTPMPVETVAGLPLNFDTMYLVVGDTRYPFTLGTYLAPYQGESWRVVDGEIVRYLSKDERDKIDASDFADKENRAYPCDTQEHVTAACKLLGHAPEAKQAAIKKRIISIAKKHGFSLPDSWESENKSERLSESVSDGGVVVVEDDMDKDKDKQEERATVPQVAHLFAPVTRVDSKKWEVEGIATSEAIDSYGTIFSYEASKNAFKDWIGRTANVREMHGREAVAKGIGVRFDDEAKQIAVHTRVSRGAPNTWAKIEDGVLCGFSVGASKPVWDTIERDGKTYPYLVSYELTELSLVDNASNPDAHGLIARADGLTEVVATTDEEVVKPEAKAKETVNRVGAKMSKETMANMHSMRDTAMKTCGCDECMSMMNAATQEAANRSAEEVMQERIDRALYAATARLQAIAGELARSRQSDASSAIVERLEAIETRVAGIAEKSALDALTASLETVKEQVQRLADQPVSGGPALRLADSANDKHVATDPTPSKEEMSDKEAIERASKLGLIDARKLSPHQQVNAAFTAIQPMHGLV